ncbi:YraN family protein [Mucispirillum schaedleri]|jgi:putative endonuclease|uniref:YraN family protein n=1 Tax=Mucispirillum schaedleri TaxID=248039 RepID=UPI0003BE11BE|nr:YraN family protein [Mucispirillum schaedleri]MCX4360421.1 YraN family protein [Mucispirillum schaedleri]SIW06137.1 conserved hypothetical protein [Mucispirillum schaedleri ASF457]
MDKILSGKDGEEKACNYLKSKKYKILEKNYRCLYGEIDIIAKYNNTLVIIEVKYRKSAKFGKGYEAVNYTKQQKIIKTLQYYINEKNVKMPVRFDVISIDDNEITHIENAFGV